MKDCKKENKNEKVYIYAFVNVNHRKGILNIYEGLTTIRDKYKTEFTKTSAPLLTN